MKLVKRFCAALLIGALLAVCLLGCSKTPSSNKNLGKTMLRLENTEFSENLFALYLSRLKGSMCSSYSYGEKALLDSFWDTYKDSTGLTYNDYYTDQVLNSAKMITAALYLFDDLKLQLPESQVKEVETLLSDWIAEEASGSEAAFNEILSAFGANIDVLRAAHLAEKKLAYLTDHLLGADGSKLGSELVEKYYRENYARFKQIFLYTSDYAYETDENGDDIYFTKEGKIAYDTTAIAQEKFDQNGDRIYHTESGKIAYDIKKGTRKQITDASGAQVIEKYTGEQLEAVLARAQEIYEKTEKGDTIGFEELIDAYNENRATEEYENGYYITASAQSVSSEVVKALFSLEVGETAKVRTEYGVHIIMRYELDDGAYANEDNSDFFISTATGTYTFMETLKGQWIREYLKPYMDKIEVVDTTVTDRYNMKSVGANFRY